MLIINPVSGKGRVKSYLLDILKTLSKDGQSVSVFVTEKHGDATEFAAQHGSEYDRLVCNGGDGTLNEVVNGLMRLPKEQRPVVGYIPLGTTNDMASSLKLPKTPEEVLAHIDEGNVRVVDIGQASDGVDSFFGYVAAFGAFTDTSYTTPQSAKNNWGYLAYMVQALSSIPHITPCHAKVTYDDGVIEDDFIFGAVVNSTSVAGIIKLSPEDVTLDDGIFEVLLIKMPANIANLNKIISNVLARDFNTEHVCLLHTKSINFEFDRPVAWTCDGEDGGTHTTVSAHNCQQALSLII
jgi:YegS/Rv2252/BmrU family lipid kinase